MRSSGLPMAAAQPVGAVGTSADNALAESPVLRPNHRRSQVVIPVGRADWTYTAEIIAILVGAALVFFLFPKKKREQELLEAYHAEDTRTRPTTRPG